MPLMPRTEDKTKKITYNIIGTPSNLQKDKSVTDKSGKRKGKGNGK